MTDYDTLENTATYNSVVSSSNASTLDVPRTRRHAAAATTSTSTSTVRSVRAGTVIHTPSRLDSSVQELDHVLQALESAILDVKAGAIVYTKPWSASSCASTASISVRGDEDSTGFVDILTELTHILEVLRHYCTCGSEFDHESRFGWMAGYFTRVASLLAMASRNTVNVALLCQQTCLWVCHTVQSTPTGSSAYITLVGVMIPVLVDRLAAVGCETSQVALTYIMCHVGLSRYLVERVVRMRVEGLKFYGPEYVRARRARIVWINILIYRLVGTSQHQSLVDMLNNELDQVLYYDPSPQVIAVFFRYQGPHRQPTEEALCVYQIMETAQSIPRAVYHDLVEQIRQCQKHEVDGGETLMESTLHKPTCASSPRSKAYYSVGVVAPVRQRAKRVWKTSRVRRKIHHARARILEKAVKYQFEM